MYVDKIVLIEDNLAEIERLKQILATKFEVRDPGQIRCFLGMKIVRLKNSISVSQRKYILDLLIGIGLHGRKPSDTSIEVGKKIEKDIKG